MRKNILKISIVAIIFILLIQITSFATNLTIQTTTNGNVYSVGATVTTTIDWTEGMQAAGFTLEYNSTKLEFVEASIGENFYNISEPILNNETGEYVRSITVSWASFEEVDLTNMTFTFKTLKTGEAKIAITNADGFSNGNLESPETIDYTTNGTKTIKILALGDVYIDGIINSKDSTTLRNYIDGTEELNEEALMNADVNQDRTADELDAELLRKYVLGANITFPIIYGDVNLDGQVRLNDAVLLKRYIAGGFEIELGEQALANADVNVDGIVNDLDAYMLRGFVAGLYDKLPARLITNTNLKVSNIENKDIISGFEQQNITVSDFGKNFDNTIVFDLYNAKGEALAESDLVGTGSIAKFEQKYEESDETAYSAEYTVIIYGDTTGDGKINAVDALALIKHINNKLPFTSEIYTEAGRILCESTEKPTAVDALAIIKHANGKYQISQVKQ